jgi:hypothetical protein
MRMHMPTRPGTRTHAHTDQYVILITFPRFVNAPQCCVVSTLSSLFRFPFRSDNLNDYFTGGYKCVSEGKIGGSLLCACAVHMISGVLQARQEGKYTYNVTLRRVCESLCPWKSNKYYLLVCVCVRAYGYAGA